MNNTPSANRKQIAFYGKTNAGKSSLLNALIGQDVSLVSPIKGTTTDPVIKIAELIPFGPVVFIDTAGLDDRSELGQLRVGRSLKILQRTDFAIYVSDAADPEDGELMKMIPEFRKHRIPYLVAVNKIDTVTERTRSKLEKVFKDAVFVSSTQHLNIDTLRNELVARLGNEAEATIAGDLVPSGGTVVLVVPVDSEAPKGRIILPQVQLIRDCLDHGIKSYVVRDTELASALQDLKNVDLVVTDSQAFKAVSKIVPPPIKLTSFSILYARYKGDLGAFLNGVRSVEKLRDGSSVLIAESCSHNHSHEDIGRVKIPTLLNAFTGKKLEFDFKMGYDFPEDLTGYDLVVHCGSCMLNKKTLQSRIDLCKENNVSITNYGVLLAYLNGILARTVEIFKIKVSSV